MTSDQETRVLAMLSAFEAGKKISELDTASGSVSDMRIEVLDTDGESKVMNLSEAVTTAANAVCGRYWNESNSTYRAAGYHGSLDMLRKLPELLGLGCYLVQDDRTRRKLDPTNHYRFEDGTPAKLDGTMGQYLWCWNIGFYFAEWKVGNLKYYAVSLSPIKGKQCVYIPAGGLSALGGGVMDRTNNILCSVVSDAAQYRGGNNYVGYVTFHDYCLARKQNKKNLCREVAKLRKRGMSDEEIRIKASSRLGFMQHCNSIYLLKTLNMKTFSEVTNSSGNLTGDKYHIDDILNREIHLKGFEIKASKYKGECLIIQYDIYEQVKDKTGALLTDDDGSPKMDWVEHITFTGSEALIKQLKDVVLDEPCSAKIIKQPIGDRGKCFYKITDPD